MKKYLTLILASVLVASCKQSEIQTNDQAKQGKLIEVALTLPLDQPQAITRANNAPTTWSGDGFDVELSTTPIETHQSNPMSKAVDDATVANVWVLQFDGTTPTAKLIQKLYVPTYVAGSTIELIEATSANRVAIVANTFKPTWADSFIIDITTWEEISLINKKDIYEQVDLFSSFEGTDYLPMSGSIETATITVGAVVKIPLIRTVAQVVVNLKSGIDLKATELDIQMCNVPYIMGQFFDNNKAIWPTSFSVTYYSLEHVTGVTTTDFVSHTFWVPVNRRGTVAGTTGPTRSTNAPRGATYLAIRTNGVARYVIYLGNDFATDYNIDANTKYTYSLTLQTDPTETDSRVGSLFLIGQFGGELVQNSKGEWQFTKKLYLDDEDTWEVVAGSYKRLLWAKALTATGVTSTSDGKGNTLALNNLGESDYPAANACFQKNAGWESFTSNDDAGYAWFLPAVDQLMALATIYPTIPTYGAVYPGVAFADLRTTNYWSSTEFNASSPWYGTLFSSAFYNTTLKNRVNFAGVRCVREEL